MPPQPSSLFDPETKLHQRFVIGFILRRDIGTCVRWRPDVDNVAKALCHLVPATVILQLLKRVDPLLTTSSGRFGGP